MAARLRAVDRKLPTKLRRELRKSVRPAVRKVKRKVRALPVKGVRGGTKKHPHTRRQLRRKVARGVRVQASTRTGVRIVTSMPTRDEAVLPRGLDSQTRTGGWRHPVFGRRDTWAESDGGSWFIEPIADERDEIARDVRGVLKDAAGWVAGRRSV
ncbi:hypothetical protein [Nocardiopsis gilva]|uniref:hypothetical protein n=1 Tax=Nocardiopsis gilva TaxID=280236 RepID=UPI001267BEDE|nr:hypothetical protein [Nocardiopsis gilva]